MYGKIFESIYDGTLAEDWRALITFQQMIILCDSGGFVDMTPSSISRRTGIPIEHIKAGIEILESPDEYSRTDGDQGRRITRLDDHRPWGWHVVNHEKYRDLTDYERVKEQNRERQRRKRMSDVGFKVENRTGECVYCGDEATGVDHLIPVSKGGDDNTKNLVECCKRCNQKKMVRTVYEFLSDLSIDFFDWSRIGKNENIATHISLIFKDGHVTVTDVTGKSRHTDEDTDTDTNNKNNNGQNKFDLFWSVYPRKVKKKRSKEIWISKKLNPKLDQILSDIQTRLDKHIPWKNGFIPHPTTYLNGERWNDEIEEKELTKGNGKIKLPSVNDHDGIDKLGRQLGMSAKTGEDYWQYRQRLQAAL